MEVLSDILNYSVYTYVLTYISIASRGDAPPNLRDPAQATWESGVRDKPASSPDPESQTQKTTQNLLVVVYRTSVPTNSPATSELQADCRPHPGSGRPRPTSQHVDRACENSNWTPGMQGSSIHTQIVRREFHPRPGDPNPVNYSDTVLLTILTIRLPPVSSHPY